MEGLVAMLVTGSGGGAVSAYATPVVTAVMPAAIVAIFSRFQVFVS